MCSLSEKTVVGVRFRRAGKVYYFDPADTQVAAGDTVIVETVRGVEAAQVVVASRSVPESELTQPLRSVLRKASADDVAQLAENRLKEKEALRECAARVAEHNLDMSLVGAEYTFDRGKLIIYFTAEGRVDFRQLVRDLSATFKTRIELRQIGVRDEAKMVGGLGSCGRQLCCCTFLSEFQPVSIKMAKKQDLSLNPAKISGLCGRLMCCLRYECDGYPDQRTAAAVGSTTGAPATAGSTEADDHEGVLEREPETGSGPEPEPGLTEPTAGEDGREHARSEAAVALGPGIPPNQAKPEPNGPTGTSTAQAGPGSRNGGGRRGRRRRSRGGGGKRG